MPPFDPVYLADMFFQQVAESVNVLFELEQSACMLLKGKLDWPRCMGLIVVVRFHRTGTSRVDGLTASTGQLKSTWGTAIQGAVTFRPSCGAVGFLASRVSCTT